MSAPIDIVIDALDRHGRKPKRSGKGYAARCPAHDDHSPSLSVDEGSDGCVLITCHVGCTTEQITDSLGLEMSDLFPRNGATVRPEAMSKPQSTYVSPIPKGAPQSPGEHPTLGKPSKRWNYYDEQKRPLFSILRFDAPGGKQIRPLTLWKDHSGKLSWEWKAAPSPRPLYGLQHLAASPDADVIVVEGEKGADAARVLFPDAVVVTSSGGSSATNKTNWSPLTGRSITVWPDNDEPGRKYADEVCRLALEAGAKSVAVVVVPDTWPAGWDLADSFPNGVTLENLKRMIGGAVAVDVVEPDLGVLGGYRRPAPELPLDLFGRWSPWCTAAAEGAGAPVDFTACALLAVAAGAIGNAARISPWPGWSEPAVLWIGLVGDPGCGKSPATDPILEAIARIERRWSEPWEAEHRQWEESAALATAIQSGWKQAVTAALKKGSDPPPMPDCEIPPEPQRPRLRISDATPEAVEGIMAGNPRGLLLVRDELSAWLGSYGRYSGAGAGERAGWLEAYGARAHVCDRVTAGRSAVIPRYAVSILGTIQPSRLDRLLLAGDDDGLPSRHAWCWPEAKPPRRPQRCADVAALEIALEWLRSLPMPADENGDPFPLLVRLAPDAADLLDEWRTEHAKHSASLAGMMSSAAAKGPGTVLRLALVLGLLDVAGTGAPPPSEISGDTLARGIALWTDYFLPMAARVLGDAAQPEADRDAATLARWIAATRPEAVNARALRRHVRLPGLTVADRVTAALSALTDAAWLVPPCRDFATGGRPRADYTVRPEVFAALDLVAGGIS